MSTDAIPLFSVVLPTHNRAALLPVAISSALQQTCGDLELLIMDDGSTDNTADVVASFDDRRIHYHHHNQPTGAAAARNRGIAAARGRYVSFLDDDDELLPEFLQQTRLFFERAGGSDLAMTFTNVQWVTRSDNGDQVVRTIEHNGMRFDDQHQNAKDLLTICRLATSWGITIKRTALLDVGGFDERLTISEDRDLFVRLLARGYGAAAIGHPLVKFMNHGGVRLTDHRRSRVKAECDAQLIANSREFLRRFPLVYCRFNENLAGDWYRAGNYDAALRCAWEAVKARPLRLKAQRRLWRAGIANLRSH